MKNDGKNYGILLDSISISFIYNSFLIHFVADMAQLINVRLSRVDAQPWGLRLQGGMDFGTPLVVQKVSSSLILIQFLVRGDIYQKSWKIAARDN